MELITDVRDLEGKTILMTRAVDFQDSIGLTFTDNTFCILIGKSGYDGGASVELEEYAGNHILVELGLMSEAEHDKLLEAQYAKGKAAQLEQDRKQYERLKLIFEKGGS